MRDRGNSEQRGDAVSRRDRESDRNEPYLTAAQVRKEMCQWALAFTGDSREDPEEFLRKIRRGRSLVAIRDRDALRCVAFFLTGAALRWYEAKEYTFETWEDFALSFRRRFGARDAHLILRDNIARQTQDEGESIADYFENLTALMQRLERPMARDDQVYYAYRNLLPKIQLAITERSFMDLEELEEAARAAEQKLEIANRHRAPHIEPMTEVGRRKAEESKRGTRMRGRKDIASVVEPELKELGQNRQRERKKTDKNRVTWSDQREEARVKRSPEKRDEKHERENDAILRVSAPPPAQPDAKYEALEGQLKQLTEAFEALVRAQAVPRENNRAEFATRERRNSGGKEFRASLDTRWRPNNSVENQASQNSVCWNCARAGHFSRDCPQPPRQHCYHCGEKGQTVRTCPKCTGNEERRQ